MRLYRFRRRRRAKDLSKGQSLILKIPSTVMLLDYNYILNPAHQDMTAVSVITITDYVWDWRMKR